MQTTSSRIWTRVTESISNDYNRYVKGYLFISYYIFN